MRPGRHVFEKRCQFKEMNKINQADIAVKEKSFWLFFL
jgi:hypothetical protein